MSLQDKINSAKPTTFLTDGLSPEEVRECVEKGRRRMMKLKIELPDRVYKDIKENLCSISDMQILLKAVKNATIYDTWIPVSNEHDCCYKEKND